MWTIKRSTCEILNTTFGGAYNERENLYYLQAVTVPYRLNFLCYTFSSSKFLGVLFSALDGSNIEF